MPSLDIVTNIHYIRLNIDIFRKPKFLLSMANGKFIKNFMNVINQIQQENKQNPNEETADGSVFDLLRNKVNDLSQKDRDRQVAKGKEPKSFMDLIRNGIDHVKQQNHDDPNVKTAPQDIFNRIKQRIDERPQRRASKGLKRIVQEYNLDISRLDPNALSQVQQQYVSDQNKLNKQYAQFLNNMIQKQR